MGANVLAVGLFAFGLLAPLTPSFGLPSAWELMLFAFLPIAALVWCATVSRLNAARVMFYVQAGVMFLLVAWLLKLQAGI